MVFYNGLRAGCMLFDLCYETVQTELKDLKGKSIW